MSVASHLAGKDPTVRATYQRLIDVARTLGPVTEEAKKTSIHLVRRTAFAGVATRRSSLILTLKSATDISSPRIERREQTSANRWHLEVRLEFFAATIHLRVSPIAAGLLVGLLTSIPDAIVTKG